jgi:hypothetical protein
MCTVASVNGVDVETVGALADALGMEPASIGDSGPEFCLCGVDLRALGFRQATADEGYPFPEWIYDDAKAKEGEK